MRKLRLYAMVLVIGILSFGGVSNAAAGDVVKVNINTASAEELTRLNGIGPSHAAEILAYRQKNGPFETVEGLMQVSGIGPKTLEKNQGLILVDRPDKKLPKK